MRWLVFEDLFNGDKAAPYSGKGFVGKTGN